MSSDFNPYASSESGGYGNLPPKPDNSPKTFGILNIVFASLLLLFGLCCGIYAGLGTAMGPAMAQQQQDLQKKMDEARDQEMEALQDEIDTADTEEAKVEAQADLDKLKNQPKLQAPDMSGVNEMSKRLAAYMAADVFSGLVLNVLMLIAGIGLLSFSEWARKLAIWVAALKIVRLIAVSAYQILVVAPTVAEGTGQFFDDLQDMQPNPAMQQDMQQIAAMYGTMITGWAVALLVVGMIYPILTLVFLSKKSAVAACQPKAEY